jgi:8-amino-7-oxononanoate synthase
VQALREALTADLDGLRAAGLHRRLRGLETMPGPRGLLEGRPVLILGSNNYLGLAGHPALRAAAAAAVGEWGAGSSGSRLTTGNLRVHEELERKLAELKGTEDALLFASGYQAAAGTIPALATRGDLVLSDALNHACLIDGCRLSRAEVRVYRHADVEHARALLADRHRFRRCLLVTDGVFSMDGDLAPLPDLVALCEASASWLMVDDAHGTGVLGATGGGSTEHFGLRGRVAVQMGTLSKALGAEGGFIAGCRELIDYLRNRARTFIFSTAPAPASAAAASAALDLLRAEPELRRRLAANAVRLRDGLRQAGFQVPEAGTPIIPIVVGAAGAAVAFAAALEARGIWAPAIRPPTVPEGTARLRVTVMAAHSDADVEEALRAFGDLSGSLRLSG